MYKQYFKLRENPFKLAPSPAYFYLSSGHEEALAHIKYGILEGEGFISITGKTGVGKTVTCMAFIASLGEKIEAAYISNPLLSSNQLYRKICEKFKIGYGGRNGKYPLNDFYSFLIRKKVSGKRVVLFIDEAQKLKKDAVEQIRLLSNLETNRDKLLQIVLVGQPGLTDMLNSYELRQIGQRISVHYCINPLSFLETQRYILYRLKIASQSTMIEFDQSAFRRIFRYSSGIPRLINIACDKVLLTSYINSQKTITGDTAKVALSQLPGKADGNRWPNYIAENQSKLIIAGSCLILFLATVFLTKFISSKNDYKFKEPIKVSTALQEPPELFKSDYRHWKQEIIPKVANNSTASHKSGRITDLMFSPPQKVAGEAYVTSKMTHSVQVGAFLIKTNAEKIKGLLKKKGYDARIIIFVDSKKRTWHTVRIGNYPSSEIAKRYANAFTSKEKLESAVVPIDSL
jgi:type II secretory pathway predicted ATPase ExeA/cell division septation protein DedD